MVAACLLGSLYRHAGAEEALQRVQRCLSLREAGCRSPETEAQVEAVREWFKRKRP